MDTKITCFTLVSPKVTYINCKVLWIFPATQKMVTSCCFVGQLCCEYLWQRSQWSSHFSALSKLWKCKGCVCVLLLPASVCAPGADWKLLYAAGFHCKAVARQESSLCESEDQARHRAPPSSHSKARSEKNFSKSHSNPESDWEASAVIVRCRCYLGSFDNSSLCNFWFFTWFSLQGSCAKLLMEKM